MNRLARTGYQAVSFPGLSLVKEAVIARPFLCWLAPGGTARLTVDRGSGQVSLTGHGGIIRANQLRRRLIRRRGRAVLQRAFGQAYSVIAEWAGRGRYRTRVDESMRRFR